jgi:hypothetical protein
MQSPKGPVLSYLQGGPDRGIDRYVAYRSSSGLPELWSNFIWHHHNLCLFHQAIFKQIDQRNAQIQQLENKPLASAKLQEELEIVVQHRLWETIHVLDMEKQSIRVFADQLLVIALWAMVEQYCGRTLREVERSLRNESVETETPHKWSALVRRFRRVGVDVTNCKSYAAADECRVLNNKIKHLGKVDSELSQFERFQTQLGKNLNEVELDPQYYSDFVQEFVTCVMETADTLLFNAGDRT